MTIITRRTMLASLGGIALGSVGCGMNPFLLPQLLTSENRESIIPAEFPLKSHSKKSDVPVKVVVLVSAAPGLSPDLAGVDRMLNKAIIESLEANTKKNEEKVIVLAMQFIDKIRADNPNWRGMNPYDIGKKFEGTDYVIDVEIGEMDLFKPNSRGEFLQGRASVSVTAFDMTKPLKDPVYRRELTFEYPRNEIPIETRSRTEVSNFRIAFVQRIATEVTLKFTAAPADYKRQLGA